MATEIPVSTDELAPPRPPHTLPLIRHLPSSQASFHPSTPFHLFEGRMGSISGS